MSGRTIVGDKVVLELLLARWIVGLLVVNLLVMILFIFI